MVLREETRGQRKEDKGKRIKQERSIEAGLATLPRPPPSIL